MDCDRREGGNVPTYLIFIFDIRGLVQPVLASVLPNRLKGLQPEPVVDYKYLARESLNSLGRPQNTIYIPLSEIVHLLTKLLDLFTHVAFM